MIKNKIPLPRDSGAWQGPEMFFPLLSFRCAAGGARRETVANTCDVGAANGQGSYINLNWHLTGQLGASCKFIMPACCRQAQLLWKTRACTSQPGNEPPPPPPPQGPSAGLPQIDHHWNWPRILDKLELAPDWPVRC